MNMHFCVVACSFGIMMFEVFTRKVGDYQIHLIFLAEADQSTKALASHVSDSAFTACCGLHCTVASSLDTAVAAALCHVEFCMSGAFHGFSHCAAASLLHVMVSVTAPLYSSCMSDSHRIGFLGQHLCCCC